VARSIYFPVTGRDTHRSRRDEVGCAAPTCEERAPHALGGALLALIVGRTVAPASTQNCETPLAKLRSGERALVVGGVSDFGPFNVVAKDGRLTGMDRDIIRQPASGSASRRSSSR